MPNPSRNTQGKEQLLFDWSATAERTEAQDAQAPKTESSEEILLPSGDIQTPSDAGLVQILPWDFRTSFPEPSDEAIDAGKLHEDDCAIENLKSLHEEHARHALALLSDLDAVTDARRRGVNPSTGKAPRNPKQKELLEKLFAEEPARLEHAFEVLIDVYEDAFGEVAAEAFRKAVRAWHAGVEVISERSPLPAPLQESVEAGVFGKEEDGTVVHPSGEEVHAITEPLADELVPLPDGPERRALLSRYAADFGIEAAVELDRWTRLKAQTEEIKDVQYDPGHPWHYLQEGDGADPVAVGSIPARAISIDEFGLKWPKNHAKRRDLMQQMHRAQKTQLAEDERRYQDLVDRGVEALSRYDREIAHGGNDDLAWASTIALKFNHISSGRGRINSLEQQLGSLHIC